VTTGKAGVKDLFKVTIQATPAQENNWRVVTTGAWSPGQPPELEDHVPAEVLATLFAVTPSPTDKSSRNQVQHGDMAYAVVFRRVKR